MTQEEINAHDFTTIAYDIEGIQGNRRKLTVIYDTENEEQAYIIGQFLNTVREHKRGHQY